MAGKLYVGGLAWAVDTPTLQQAFESFGQVTDAIVMMDREDPTRSRGFGFVTFADVGDAERAQQEMNGHNLAGREIRVNMETGRSGGGGRGPSGGAGAGGGGGGGEDSTTEYEENSKLFFGNVPFSVDTEKLVAHVSASHSIVWGEVAESRNGRSRGFGLVQCESAESASAIIEAFNETELDGRTIFVRHDQPEKLRATNGPRYETSNEPREPRVESVGDGSQVYVGNLSFDVNEDELFNLFTSHGDILNVAVPTGRNGRSRGYGTIQFADGAMAQAAIEAMDGHVDAERKLHVRVDKFRASAVINN